MEKVKKAFIRALWTGGQTIIGFYTAGMAITDIDWKVAISVTAAAMVFSFIKSMLVGMPENVVATVMTDEEALSIMEEYPEALIVEEGGAK